MGRVGGTLDEGNKQKLEDEEENAVQPAANRSANMGAHEEERDRANFFSRLERDSVGRVERESGGSVHKPLASVTAEQRAEASARLRPRQKCKKAPVAQDTSPPLPQAAAPPEAADQHGFTAGYGRGGRQAAPNNKFCSPSFRPLDPS